MLEDRERFDELLERLQIERPKGTTVMTANEALKAANDLGYPVLMRPSYALGGQNMIIAFSDDDIREYMAIILSHEIENPVLIDKYIMGTEIEVDAICDGEDVLIPGITGTCGGGRNSFRRLNSRISGVEPERRRHTACGRVLWKSWRWR